MVSLAVAAPAMAASGCTVKTGLLAWSSQAGNGSSQSQFGKTLVTTVSGVTAVVTATGATNAAEGNGIITNGIGGANSLMLFHSVNNAPNTTQTITVKFSQKVQNVSFKFLDIDSETNGFRDSVTLVTPSTFSYSFVSTPGQPTIVTGAGTAANTWRAQGANDRVEDDGTGGNVNVSWAAPGDTITFVYAQIGTMTGSPKMGIGDIAFQTVCP